MRILFNDVLQDSDAPEKLISPSLAEKWTGNDQPISLSESQLVNSVGIGNTDATRIQISTSYSGIESGLLSENANELTSGLLAEVATPTNSGLLSQPAIKDDLIFFRDSSNTPFNNNGLYLIAAQNIKDFSLSHNGTYIGRFAMGYSPLLGASPSNEPGFFTTNNNRETLSGQVIPGAGGYSGRQIQVDFRYKITEDIYRLIERSYQGQLSKQYPLFMLFDKELHRMPYERLYAKTDANLLFQSAVNRFLYSRKFKFKEAF